MQLSLAPLQTYTDFHFRNAHQQVFSGVDRFYAPYLKLNNDGTIKDAPKKDILPVNNPFQIVVPQIMACCAKDFLFMAEYISDLGYEEVNWNLGCPYPMVTNKNLGAGLLDKPEFLLQELEEILKNTTLKVGIKMRMGVEDTSDSLRIVPGLNDFPLTELIIHARYAKQLYNGSCDHDRFAECLSLSKHAIVYNGDITEAEHLQELSNQFGGHQRFMIGRGAMINPALFEEVKTGEWLSSEEYRTRLLKFMRLLHKSLIRYNDAPGYAIGKLQSYWEYLAEGLSNGKQVYRKIKKIKEIQQFFDILEEELESGE